MTLILGTRLGLPLSTTHCKVGAVIGVGFGDGVKAVNPRTVLEIVCGWLVTVPIAAALSAVCFYILQWLLLDHM
jgi:phosphate/sulfate permease